VPQFRARIYRYVPKEVSWYDNIEIVEATTNQKSRVLSAKPDILGLKSNTLVYPQVISLANEIKKETDIPILIGGPHISFLPHTLPAPIDIGVIGEDEQTMFELMELYLRTGRFEVDALQDIDGIVYHRDGTTVITKVRDLIEPIDRIPFPDRSLFDMERYLRPMNVLHNYEYLRGTSMITSRGCAYKCIFCDPWRFWRKIRLHSAEYVAQEIRLLVDQYGVEAIDIEDSLFVLDVERVEKIVELLDSYGILGKVKFSVEGRANLINERLLRALKRMNVVTLLMGLESGSERVLRYLKKGDIRLEHNKRAVELANQFGIGVFGSFMIGSPTETKEEMLETLEFIKRYPMQRVGLGKTTPFPGCELWFWAKEKGFVQDDMDWTRFTLEPESVAHGSIYINEMVPVSDFLRIVGEFQKVIDRKSLWSFLSHLSFTNLVNYVRETLHNSKMRANIRSITDNVIRRP
jgi:anaerobic magnesium-protoporphyrin IX monomethyl ester cyclase